MRWNCPHCGINLAVSDDKLGTGWSFSRCYKCGGFALIRRAEVNLVKVDRAPAGEHIILPEASEEPLSMLSQEATQNLARLRQDSAEKAATRAAMNRHKEAILQSAAAEKPANSGIPAAPTQAKAQPLPEPLPEMPITKKRRFGIFPAAISIAGLMTIASGAYLYTEGQSLWEKTRIIGTREQSVRSASRATEVIAAPPLARNNSLDDQVHHGAMAPVRENEETGSSNPALAASSDAMKKMSTLVVQARGKSADLHSGPGSLYPMLGMAKPEAHYLVTDWNDRWFKVMLREEAMKASGNPEFIPKTAWIRTDLVQVVQNQDQETLPPHP